MKKRLIIWYVVTFSMFTYLGIYGIQNGVWG